MESFRIKVPAGFLTLLFVCALTTHAQERDDLPTYMNAQHRAVLQRWLKRERNLRAKRDEEKERKEKRKEEKEEEKSAVALRAALDEDCGQCADDIASERKGRGSDYHPYYAVGDFNGDGKQDFAVAVIEQKVEGEMLTPKFIVAVFNGPFSRSATQPAFVRDGLNLRDGGLFFGPPKIQSNRLFIGLFINDQGLTLIPKGRKYIAQ